MRLLTCVLLLACLPLAAEPLKVGDDAADFAPSNWINPPTFTSFAELRGDVILLKTWGISNAECVKQLPEMNEYHKKPGLHVVSLYTEVHKFEDLEAAVTKHKIEYPIALDSFWPAGYPGDVVPNVWIIGTDGKVKFIGTDFKAALDEELAKVTYPGLGRDKIAKAAEEAVILFVQGKFAAAYKAAEAITSEGAADDAEWIMKRIDERVKTLANRAETAESERRYDVAKAAWKELARYAGIEDAAQAAERLKKLNESAEVKKEQSARRELIKLQYVLAMAFRKINKDDAAELRKFRERSMNDYQKFAEKHKGTAAGDIAAERVESFKELLKESD
ncbi:MAG: hypothetical protein IT464_05730 [Planctomycetes bacterium]|nr:hypothetical protein [Planctomycetota bacterium]